MRHWLVIAILFAFSACADHRAVVDEPSEASAAEPQPAPAVHPPLLRLTNDEVDRKTLRAAAASINAFGAALYPSLESRDNVLFSPVSVAMALSMLAAGASGKTEEQLARGLRFSLPPQQHHRALAALKVQLERYRKPRLRISVANGFFGNEELPFLPAYLEQLREVYGGEAELLNFGNSQRCSRRVNDWIAESTRNKITGLVTADAFEPDPQPAALVLVNATYFRGRWEEEFFRHATRKRTFWAHGTTEVWVPTMEQETDFPFRRHQDFSALEMRYKGGPFSMVILLPHERDGIATVERACLHEDLAACTRGLSYRRAHVRMPKLEQTTEAFSLKPGLRTIGMSSLFENGEYARAVRGSAVPLYVRDVVQKVFVAVDEKGTEAAAATGVFGGAGDMPPRPVRFFVDRPFIFLIRDRQTRVVLFVGRINDPTA